VPQVLHVITRGHRRGAETAAVALCADLGDLGWPGEVVALAPGRDGAGLDVPVLGHSPRAPATLRALRRRSADALVVIAHGSATLWASALAVAFTGRPFVYVSIGDPRFWSATASRRWRTGLALRRAGAVVALAPSAAVVLRRWFDLPGELVHVLPNVRSPRRFQPATPDQRARSRHRLGLGADDQVVLVLGALSPEKRPLAAIESALAIPGVRVVVAGDGPLRAEVAAVGARHRDRVHVVGPVDDPRALIHAADALLLASASEGLPGVVIEAGLCGVPTVSTDVGWVGDLVVDGETGALADPDDPSALSAALRRVLADRVALGAGARARCLAGYTDDLVLPGWVALLDSLAPSHLVVPR
jgi:glycosyltransferase involved in cell wall biosynthesis